MPIFAFMMTTVCGTYEVDNVSLLSLLWLNRKYSSHVLNTCSLAGGSTRGGGGNFRK